MTTQKHIPGKRLKTWHRAYKRSGGNKSLRQFAREMARDFSDRGNKTARLWAGGKVAP